jgi:prevent-host-death family protein
MATQTVTIQVDQTTAEVARALMAEAETAGKSTADLLDELRATGQPLILTINGGETVVIQSGSSYQKLLAEIERAETLAGIREGLEDLEAGRTQLFPEFLAELRQESGFPAERPATI